MASLSEQTAQIITARLAKRDMSLEELQKEIAAIGASLKAIDSGTILEPVAEPQIEEPKKEINFKQIFKKDEVICLICNKGFKTLKRHLTKAHQLTDKEYRASYNIPTKQPLVAKAYSDKKKTDALKNNLGAKMQAGRLAKAGITSGELFESVVPVVEEKTAAPVTKAKTTRTKAAVPAKKKETKASVKPKKPTTDKQ